MRTYTHTLSPIEEACGVTLEQVADALPKCKSNGLYVITPDVPPALAGSVARCYYGGGEVEFSHLALGKYPAYRLI